MFDTFFKETGTDTTVLAQVFTSGHFLYHYRLCAGRIGAGFFSDQECDGLC
mgnify:FL=1